MDAMEFQKRASVSQNSVDVSMLILVSRVSMLKLFFFFFLEDVLEDLRDLVVDVRERSSDEQDSEKNFLDEDLKDRFDLVVEDVREDVSSDENDSSAEKWCGDSLLLSSLLLPLFFIGSLSTLEERSFKCGQLLVSFMLGVELFSQYSCHRAFANSWGMI